MDKKEAIAIMRKLFGKRAAYRRNEKALVGEERQAVIDTIPALSEAVKKANDAAEARRAELLKDPEYVALSAAAKDAREKLDAARTVYYVRRVTVGTLNGMFFSVKGEGDNWAEAIAKAKEKA